MRRYGPVEEQVVLQAQENIDVLLGVQGGLQRAGGRKETNEAVGSHSWLV